MMGIAKTLKIGSLELESNLLLAPLAGWTTPAFRRVVREIGGVGMATTEVIAAKALITQSRGTEEYLKRHPEDRPLAVQISAATPEEAREAALVLEARGFDAVDLNLGCPVKKIARKGGGAGLARDCSSAAAVAKAAVDAVKIPVTAKMRLGWSAGELTAPDVARALGDVGVAAIAVHGRTRSQGFKGDVDRDGIKAVVDAVQKAGPKIPVIGNGDILDEFGASGMMSATGCAGVLIGRAAVTDPWIFRRTRRFIDFIEHDDHPSLEEKLQTCEKHFRYLTEDQGEWRAALMFRKVLRAWGEALGQGPHFWDAAAQISSAGDLRALLDGVRLVDSKWAQQGLTGRRAAVVAVPDDPVDVW